MIKIEPSSTIVSSLREIADPYQVFLVDVFGVVHDGIHAYPGAILALNDLIKREKAVIFLSNTPRPGDLLKQHLIELGVQDPFQIFTSGDATRLLLQDHLEKRLFHLGSLSNQDILKGIPIQTVETVEDADLVLLSVFLEEDEPVSQFDALLQEIANRKIPVICANPDKISMNGNRIRYCAGTFAAKLESFGGAVLYWGKPNYDFYNFFYQNFIKDLPKEKILMIGDTLETDIQGAFDFHIDSFLVLTGNAGKSLKDQNLSIKNCATLWEHFSEKPTYVSENL